MAKRKFNVRQLKNKPKEDCINYVIRLVYENGQDVILTTEERKRIESSYKARYKKCKNLSDFVKNDLFLQMSLDKVPSIRNYISGQIEKKKSLQSGMLAECIFVYTLASVLGCDCFADADDSLRTIPDYVIKKWDMVKLNCSRTCAARFFYYDAKDPEKLLIQYGNPETKDASIIFFYNEIILEIKDMPAVYREKDLYYDEHGKFIVTQELHDDYPEYEVILNDFNAQNDVFSMLGHNILLDSSMITNAFSYANFDLLLTSHKNQLVVLKSSDLGALINGQTIISTKGSEIRTTGKNHAKVFTPASMDRIFSLLNIHEHCGLWFAPEHMILGPVRGRGKNEVTRIKLNECFYLGVKDVTYKNGYYIFDRKNVLQCKSGISVHLGLMFSAEDIYTALYKGKV